LYSLLHHVTFCLSFGRSAIKVQFWSSFPCHAKLFLSLQSTVGPNVVGSRVGSNVVGSNVVGSRVGSNVVGSNVVLMHSSLPSKLAHVVGHQ